ncbi:pyrroline-5-carboxylate reductase [Sinimarinibacterium sp. CAU 1509]|uniref:pyrroline-5-carboxylate reductase n=1 Tax=Sinimarinibacterium sp. CAU 1509 TaxID=2562283 RepID=UPI0010AB68DE|nr:pyrroline-5-carboxylate reductase [Sinimarinibacterium sp. CAU 1509]TJY59372.1 pyrroline-5-carboxylate reductase [Sinimarinibacterium sp. CAU 1509]
MPYHTAHFVLAWDPGFVTDADSAPEIAFIGGGNMAASLIGGWLAAGHAAASVRVVELDAARRDVLSRDFGVQTFAVAADAVRGADAVVLAVKPQQMRQAVTGLQLAAGTVVISIAAGIRLDSLRSWLGEHLSHVRCMPNTPALLRAGITGLYTAADTPATARALAQAVLEAAGKCVWLDNEAQIDAVTAVSGSGPAYYFLLTEVLREAGEALGLSADIAAQLAKQTFIGAARMAEGDTDVAELRARVTSKGGTTEAAVASLENSGLHAIFGAALAAAARRGAELGEQLSRET